MPKAMEEFAVDIKLGEGAGKITKFLDAMTKKSTLATGALSYMGKKLFGDVLDISRFSQVENVPFNVVNSFAEMDKQFGVSEDSTKSMIANIQKLTTEAAQGTGRGSQLFQKMGISARDASGHVKSFKEVIKDVAALVSRQNNRQVQLDLLQQFGINPNMIQMLDKGTQGLKRFEAQAGGLMKISKQATDDINQEAQALSRLWSDAKVFGEKVVGSKFVRGAVDLGIEGTEKLIGAKQDAKSALKNAPQWARDVSSDLGDRAAKRDFMLFPHQSIMNETNGSAKSMGEKKASLASGVPIKTVRHDTTTNNTKNAAVRNFENAQISITVNASNARKTDLPSEAELLKALNKGFTAATRKMIQQGQSKQAS